MSETKKKNHGGAREGAGAPRKYHSEKVSTISVQLRKDQIEKFKNRGKSEWLRKLVDISDTVEELIENQDNKDFIDKIKEIYCE